MAIFVLLFRYGLRESLSPAERSNATMWLAVSRALAVLASLGAVVAAPFAQVRADDFQISFAAGSPDAAGHFAGGTEMRLLTAHAGRLYAGNGYWEDRPGPEGRQGAQLLALDRPGMPWRVDHAFESVCRMGGGATSPSGRWPKPILPRTVLARRCRGQSRCCSPR